MYLVRIITLFFTPSTVCCGEMKFKCSANNMCYRAVPQCTIVLNGSCWAVVRGTDQQNNRAQRTPPSKKWEWMLPTRVLLPGVFVKRDDQSRPRQLAGAKTTSFHYCRDTGGSGLFDSSGEENKR